MLKDINTTIKEGELLYRAIGVIMTHPYYIYQTPEDILEILETVE